jgi:capsule polysaccharide export protein KpsE/RkpR
LLRQWNTVVRGGEGIDDAPANAEFIAHAPDDIADLLGALEAAQDRLIRIEYALAALEDETTWQEPAARRLATRIQALRQAIAKPRPPVSERRSPWSHIDLEPES